MEELVRVLPVPETVFVPPTTEPSPQLLVGVVLQLGEPSPRVGHAVVARPSPQEAVEGRHDLLRPLRPSTITDARPATDLLTRAVHRCLRRTRLHPALARLAATLLAALKAHTQKIGLYVAMSGIL